MTRSKAPLFPRGGFCRMASIPRYLSIPLPNGSRISILHSLPFFLAHFAALLVFFIPFHWYYLMTTLALLVVRMFFVTAGYHRYFSHRSFKTSRAFQVIIAFMAMSSSQKGVLWCAAHHSTPFILVEHTYVLQSH